MCIVLTFFDNLSVGFHTWQNVKSRIWHERDLKGIGTRPKVRSPVNAKETRTNGPIYKPPTDRIRPRIYPFSVKVTDSLHPTSKYGFLIKNVDFTMNPSFYDRRIQWCILQSENDDSRVKMTIFHNVQKRASWMYKNVHSPLKGSRIPVDGRTP